MRTIVKCVAPDCLALAERNGWSWEEFVEKDREGYLSCRKQADGEQGHVCAYTELPLDVDKVTVHIDHFRKKSIFPMHKFDWGNLFASVKDHRFGADFKDKKVSGENAWQVYAEIFSPLQDGLQRLFHCATNGVIEPSPVLSDDEAKKAKATIEIFNLNEAELVERRKTMMSQIATCHDLEEDVIRCCFAEAGFPSVVDQELSFASGI